MTDLDFSPFNENLLSTCSADETVSSSILPLYLLLIDLLDPFNAVLPKPLKTPSAQRSDQSCRCLICLESGASFERLSSLVYLATQTLLASRFICSQPPRRRNLLRLGGWVQPGFFLAGCSRRSPIYPADTLAYSVCVQVKLWRLCDPELQQPSEPEMTLRPGQGRLELVLFHPTSSGLLAVGANKSPLIWDTSRQDAPLAGSNTGTHTMCPCMHSLTMSNWLN